MNCADIEVQICDYLDGVLDASGRAAVESHVKSCTGCAALLEDSRAAVAFLERVDGVEPPDALIASILYKTHGESPDGTSNREVSGAGGLLQWLKGLLQPVLAPKFAMGMAMTILSFSMIGRMAGISPQRPLTAADLQPARILESIDVKLHRAYDRAVKYYENLRLVYEIQNRLSEWSADEQAQAERERKNRRVVEPVETGPPSQDQRGDQRQ
jgi:hypothetical protein